LNLLFNLSGQEKIQMKLEISMITAFASAIACSTVPALAQDAPILEIGTIDCRTLLKMDESEKDFTLVFLHGFMSGKADNMVFDGPAFGAATGAIVEECIDNPSAKLLDIFGKHRG
jgi:hypothetical protein